MKVMERRYFLTKERIIKYINVMLRSIILLLIFVPMSIFWEDIIVFLCVYIKRTGIYHKTALCVSRCASTCHVELDVQEIYWEETLVKNKREGWEGRWEEPSDHDASLRPVKEKKK